MYRTTEPPHVVRVIINLLAPIHRKKAIAAHRKVAPPRPRTTMRCILLAVLVATAATLELPKGKVGRRRAVFSLGAAMAVPSLPANGILPICEDGIKKSGCRAPYKFTYAVDLDSLSLSVYRL